MRQYTENFFAVVALVCAEAWCLKGFFAGQPDFEPTITFVVALGVLLAKEPVKDHFKSSGVSRLHDQQLFQAFLNELPTEPTIRFLKDHNFGDSFAIQTIKPLYDFVYTWDSVEKEFLDAAVEKQKKALFIIASKLVSEIAAKTVPVRDGSCASVYSDKLRASGGPRPAFVIEDANVLNATASAFVPMYEEFVRFCRLKFAV